MCGDISRQSRGGALAILSLPMKSTRDTKPAMAGTLVFHDQGKGGLCATHATFTTDSVCEASFGDGPQAFTIGIHETGDLTRSAIISPFLHKFSMRPNSTPSSPLSWRSGDPLEIALAQPMKIEVGGDGIIGRRVTVWQEHALDPIAEGIIGYN
ncbi:hypothetical protein F4778DRAFT_780949 [Xylariomycetidae sp. FL2044]|nr:hypothetical protein F4778DRAFT_780949 [Xylariomycetidae sp. FL2044]